MNKFKERIKIGKTEIIVGAIMLLSGIIITFLIYDRKNIQSGGTYTLMFGPVIAGAFFVIMGLFKK
jgi:hypothetical protein